MSGSHVVLDKYPQKLSGYLIGALFGCYLMMKSLSPNTINDSNIDLVKFHTSKVRQLAKKMESSKATTRHIKAGSKWPPVGTKLILCDSSAQISQHANTRRRSLLWNLDQSVESMMQVTDNKYPHTTTIITRKALMPRMFSRMRWNTRSVEIQYILRIWVSCKEISVQVLPQVWTLYKLMFSKETIFFSNLGNQRPPMLQVGAVYICDKVHMGHSEDFSSSNESFCMQVKMQYTQAECKKIPTPSHLIIKLAYKLKPHQIRNQYLRAILDPCADVNVMPVSVYKLVF